MAGLMTCHCTSFPQYFNPIRMMGWMMMKVVCNGTKFTIKDPHLKWGLNPGPLDQQASA